MVIICHTLGMNNYDWAQKHINFWEKREKIRGYWVKFNEFSASQNEKILKKLPSATSFCLKILNNILL